MMFSCSSSSSAAITNFQIFSSLIVVVLALVSRQNAVEAIPINQLRAAYPPISDAWLRSLLGYGQEEEEQTPRPRGLLLIHQPAAAAEESGEATHSFGAKTQLLVTKRKNAELVNHILKNFASLNRLGDAGK